MKHCLLIGSSRGLGSAMARRLLSDGGQWHVTGISRTAADQLPAPQDWARSPRYTHVQLDVASAAADAQINQLCSRVDGPLLVIFNAALMQTELAGDGSLDATSLRAVNAVGVDGLTNTLLGVQRHLLDRGGVFVGVSSFSAMLPSVADPRVAYGATKSYMNMVLAGLHLAWAPKVRVVTANLGHLVAAKGDGPAIAATYEQTAERIIAAATSSSPPQEINYPLMYSILYRFVFRCMPLRWYAGLVRRLAGRPDGQGGNP